MNLYLITSAATYPVTVEEAKAQCFAMGTSDFDGLLSGYIAAATEAAERYLGRALTAQTWGLQVDGWSNPIDLPIAPIAPMPEIKYFGESGSEQILAAGAFEVDEPSGKLTIVEGYSLPILRARTHPITVTFTTAPVPLPQSVKQAILMMVAFWFSNREAVNVGNIVNEVPMAWKHLLDPHAMVVL